jgi:hypothetical protein
VAPIPAGPWPSGGTVYFLWPRLTGDRRSPAWSVRPDEPEDEDAAWWNAEDSKVAASLLLPFYAELLAFLSEHAGPGWIERPGLLQALRARLRRLDPGRRLRFLWGALPTRAAALGEVAALVEGAGGSDHGSCTIRFGLLDAAVLHARRGERCVWLRVAPGLREDFDRFLDRSGGGRFQHCHMDWSGTGTGTPAPRPPEAG